MTTVNPSAPASLNQATFKMVVGFFMSLLLTAVLLFGGAGRLNWPLGWIFITAWTVPKLVFYILLRWRDPDLLVERATSHPNTPRYDRIILPIYFVLAFGTFLIASLDGGRFHWSGELPIGLMVVAYLIYLLGNGLAGWAVNTNPFHSAESRPQADRGQQVISRGPYQFIRHPSYLATVLLWPVTGLMLSSWWAVFPGLLTACTMILRTRYEDQMLHAELPGYSDYARRVRYRLIPGLW